MAAAHAELKAGAHSMNCPCCSVAMLQSNLDLCSFPLPATLCLRSLRSTILAGHANEDPHFRVDCEDFGEHLKL